MNPPLVGDEPHYALEAISIARDHDTDLADEYDDAALIAEVYGGTTIDPHAFAFPGGHGLRSVHGLGLPLLLAPVAAVTHSPVWMRFAVVLIAAIGAALLMALLERVPFGRAWELWAAWAAVVLSAPIVVYSGQLYPEIPGATLTLGAAVLLTRARPGPGTLAGVGAVAAALPWLNVRFLGVTLALAAIGAWRCWAQPRRATLLAALCAPLVVSGITMGVAFQHWYGSWLPTAQYGLSDSPRSWAGSYRNAVGNLLGTEYGWLPVAPVHLLGLVGVGILVGRLGRSALAGVLGAGLYLTVVSVAGVGFGGGTFPGRLLVVVVPLIAVPLLVVLATQRRWWWRGAFALLAGLSLALTAHAIADDASPAPPAPGTPLARYERAWPDLTHAEHQPYVQWDGAPARLDGDVGRVSRQTPPGRGVAGSRSAPPGRAGVLLRGTTPPFPPSAYQVGIHLRASAPASGTVATLEVRDEHGRIDFARTVSGAALPPQIGWRDFEMPFHTPNAGRLTITVRTTGAVGLGAGAPAIRNSPGATQQGVRGFPALGATLAWTVALLAAGVGAARYDRRHAGRISRA